MEEVRWEQIVERWRALSPEEQLRIRLSRIPRRVARSMAFEGEPVDERMLEAELGKRYGGIASASSNRGGK
ncbi:MAG: hypothetical protein F9K24_16175 [Leptonema illini]|uniref:Uncharacterized protein n=1 Tax=Leptonema illini TaxID=183 RepID=A0A833H095_9LEPT|nr:MAG: hypothetical protein F9K24_16175 [Leptonema illini]